MATTDQPIPPFRAARWGQRTLFGLGALGVGASVLGVAGSATVAHILTRPRRLRAVAAREIDDGVEEVTFRTDDGLTLRGWYLPRQAPRDAIVICHGFAMNRHELLDLARALRERGHAVLLFDFRAHGASEGARSTIGYREADDIRAAVAHLRDRPELAGLRIGAAGISMGAAAALLAAAREPAIAAVVADSSFATLRGIAADGLRALARRPVRSVPTPKLPAVLAPRLRPLARLPALYAPLVVRFGELLTRARIESNRPIDAVAALAPRPLLLIHGADDRFIPPVNAHALYRAAGEPKELWIVPGCGHAGAWARRSDEYGERLDRFFARALARRVP